MGATKVILVDHDIDGLMTVKLAVLVRERSDGNAGTLSITAA